MLHLQGFWLQGQRSFLRAVAACGGCSPVISCNRTVLHGRDAMGDKGCNGGQVPLGPASVSHPPSVALRFYPCNLRGAWGTEGGSGTGRAVHAHPPPHQSSSTFMQHRWHLKKGYCCLLGHLSVQRLFVHISKTAAPSPFPPFTSPQR